MKNVTSFKQFVSNLNPSAIKFVTRKGDDSKSYSFMRLIYGGDKALGICLSPELKTMEVTQIISKAKDLVVTTEEKEEAEVVNGEIKTVAKTRYWLGLSEGTDITSDLMAALAD